MGDQSTIVQLQCIVVIVNSAKIIGSTFGICCSGCRNQSCNNEKAALKCKPSPLSNGYATCMMESCACHVHLVLSRDFRYGTPQLIQVVYGN